MPDALDDRILDLLERGVGTALSPNDIAARLGLRGKSRKALEKRLRALRAHDRVVRSRDGRYRAAPSSARTTVRGTIAFTRSRDAVVTGETFDGAIRVPARLARGALPMDRVEVALLPDDPEGPATGRVTAVLERSRREHVGSLRRCRSRWIAVPLDPSFPRSYAIAGTPPARNGDRVVFRFRGWPNRRSLPEAEIVDTIGPVDDPSTDTVAVIRHYGFRTRFPSDARREAKDAVRRLEAPGRRRDLRDRCVLTIDPDTARDFDDALSLEEAGGRRVLGVHIADVSHFVTPGSALDAEARVRGNSVYMPDTVLPMLPEALSNGVCSLRPHEDRLAFSVFLTYDENGRLLETAFDRTLIHSRARLTYTQATALLEDGTTGGVGDDAAALLRSLDTLTLQLRRARMAAGALDFDRPDYRIRPAQGERPAQVVLEGNARSHHLIEECMLAANLAVGQALAARGPSIYRVHPRPAPLKLQKLRSILDRLGVPAGRLSSRRDLQRLLSHAAGHPLESLIKIELLRCLARAEYSTTPGEHYGLAVEAYAHFTSPIRRYPDLVVHRLLASSLRRADTPPATQAALAPIASDCSRTEQAADTAERDLLEMTCLRVLDREARGGAGRARDAVVVHAARFGVFVELCDMPMQGLVHVSALSDSKVHFSHRRQTLRSGSIEYQPGTRLRVTPEKVDFGKRKVSFYLA